ncbi:MAG: hypothetical protein HY815_25600 [Candidatus Riflebacteria bacterium]|nr:hypothetical protein [Candidatus Riflebacteria bacterium]
MKKTNRGERGTISRRRFLGRAVVVGLTVGGPALARADRSADPPGDDGCGSTGRPGHPALREAEFWRVRVEPGSPRPETVTDRSESDDGTEAGV